MRVRSRNGTFAPSQPFTLNVQVLAGNCRDVTSTLPASTLQAVASGARTVILVDWARLGLAADEEAACCAKGGRVGRAPRWRASSSTWARTRG
ncbi:MAG: hypothetical protein R2854_26380 [Caldilineaceae bacterium]